MKIIKNRHIYLTISLVFCIISLLFLFLTKLNLWIDMTGGIQTEYSYEKNFEIQETKQSIEKLAEKIQNEGKKAINWINMYKISWENKVSLVAWFDTSIEEKTSW